ncbi:PREDICTED: two pore calcium channel protein 2-like [Priapulus caudatus]|uniref:Two pore calcium channel protein 2-like n=1 Tax=Priapulus caudatus TaxID=37621 RepID=A0ABM1EUM6_PRICU|nr:PREDICTED: two pore calcium channel protein 2-like [Priapulus caudatus]XP_014675898.1 PREDICTED: two pore calcium channel protein 2-like [Priapulus caudatus]
MAIGDKDETEPLLRGRTAKHVSSQRLASMTTWFVSHDDIPSHAAIQEKTSGLTLDDVRVLQAVTFIEDALRYRSIHHRVDRWSLKLHRWYYSWPVQWSLYMAICIIHLLAFFEFPSSLSVSSDIRYNQSRLNPPCGVTEAIEIICLLLFAADILIKGYLIGTKQVKRNKWLLVYSAVVAISIIDCNLSLLYSCSDMLRIRRILRPFFLLQSSSVMKKTINCITRTLPEIGSVLLLLCLHLYLFTMFGMLLFPQQQGNSTALVNESRVNDEGNVYFSTLSDSFMNLLILLTTANNPDVMMPAYQYNRFYVLYFIVFLFVGLHCFMNMLTAVIYNQFRGYLVKSMETSLFRRRLGVRAAFDVLLRIDVPHSLQADRGFISKQLVRRVIEESWLKTILKDKMLVELDRVDDDESVDMSNFQEFFNVFYSAERERPPKPSMKLFMNPSLCKLQQLVAHDYFTYFGLMVAFANVVCITVELATKYDTLSSSNSLLATLNLIFILYYLLEQLLKLTLIGWRHYCYERKNVFDLAVTALLVIIEIYDLAMYGLPFYNEGSVHHRHGLSITLWDLVRIVNMIIICRLLRVIPHIKTMSLVVGTLFNLIHNLRPFAGVLVVAYYSFAILGMELFRDVITYDASTNATTLSYECGTYEQLGYWANNFNDFAASIVLLWDVMVTNNWQVILHAYAKATSGWSQLYFVSWYVVSVLICLNIFMALILEAFVMNWDHNSRSGNEEIELSRYHGTTPQDLFRDVLAEPSEPELQAQLMSHEFLSEFELSVSSCDC